MLHTSKLKAVSVLVKTKKPLPGLKESLSQTEGDMGSLDTAASPSVFTRTQKQTSTPTNPENHASKFHGGAKVTGFHPKAC